MDLSAKERLRQEQQSADLDSFDYQRDDEDDRFLSNGLPRPRVPPTLGERIRALMDRYSAEERWFTRLENRPVLFTVLAAVVAGGTVAALAGGWSVWQQRSAPPVDELLPMIEPASPGAIDPASAPIPGSGSNSATLAEAPAAAATQDLLAPTGTGAAAAEAEAPGATPTELAIHIAGAVATPGVVYLPPGSRVIDAVEAGGGAIADADLDRLNLATPIDDGEQVYVPLIGEQIPTVEVPTPTPSAAGAPTTEAIPILIDINSATELELQDLPGIGPTMAAAIVSYRDSVGGFISIEELTNVSGIGPTRLETIRPLVAIEPIGIDGDQN